MTKSLKTMLLIAAFSVGLGACTSTPTQESTGEYIDDTTITAKVKAKFVESKEVSASAINVETFKGVVQLSGFANSRHESDKATEIARHIKGVKSVKNDIRLKAAQ